jgi:Cu/Ag efflux pump CusA
VPLFALPGIEGRFFVPLAIAFIVSILGSLFVSITITPVLSYYLLPNLASKAQHESKLVGFLKRHYERSLTLALAKPKRIMQLAAGLVVIAIASVPFFSTSFLPPFNEGSLVLSMRLNPGTTLAETSQIGTAAENLIRQVPEVSHVGRRSGRAEMDEHAEGVYSSEIEKNSNLKNQDKIIDICEKLNAKEYINLIGGRELYKKEEFISRNIELSFIDTRPEKYQQFNNKFTTSLSIIDIMMFNNKVKINNMLNNYQLIQN